MNVEAWRVYQTLCGRTVGLSELHGYVLSRMTETWPLEAVLDLLKRIDCLLDILDPKERTATRG